MTRSQKAVVTMSLRIMIKTISLCYRMCNGGVGRLSYIWSSLVMLRRDCELPNALMQCAIGCILHFVVN